MGEVTIQYTDRVAGHPEPGSRIRVERTTIVDGLLAAGYAVIVEEDDSDGE